MHSVQIPDQLFDQAQRVAAASGLSVERLVAEALEDRLREDEDDSPLQLTPEQIEIVRKGQSDIKAGRGRTMEQVKEGLAANRANWRSRNS